VSGLEFGVLDHPGVGVREDLQFHDVAAVPAPIVDLKNPNADYAQVVAIALKIIAPTAAAHGIQ
jgi:hypothetical protein